MKNVLKSITIDDYTSVLSVMEGETGMPVKINIYFSVVASYWTWTVCGLLGLTVTDTELLHSASRWPNFHWNADWHRVHEALVYYSFS